MTGASLTDRRAFAPSHCASLRSHINNPLVSSARRARLSHVALRDSAPFSARAGVSRCEWRQIDSSKNLSCGRSAATPQRARRTHAPPQPQRSAALPFDLVSRAGNKSSSRRRTPYSARAQINSADAIDAPPRPRRASPQADHVVPRPRREHQRRAGRRRARRRRQEGQDLRRGQGLADEGRRGARRGAEAQGVGRGRRRREAGRARGRARQGGPGPASSTFAPRHRALRWPSGRPVHTHRPPRSPPSPRRPPSPPSPPPSRRRSPPSSRPRRSPSRSPSRRPSRRPRRPSPRSRPRSPRPNPPRRRSRPRPRRPSPPRSPRREHTARAQERAARHRL